jgi:hypothetical protein
MEVDMRHLTQGLLTQEESDALPVKSGWSLASQYYLSLKVSKLYRLQLIKVYYESNVYHFSSFSNLMKLDTWHSYYMSINKYDTSTQ